MKIRYFGLAIVGLWLAIVGVPAGLAGSDIRYLPDKPGFWQPLRYLGEHGAGATAAEAQQITANLKAIQAVLMATPIGTNPVGFYYLPAPMWTSTRGNRPILQGLGIYPLTFVEFLRNGVWTLDMHGETASMEYSLNLLSDIERVSSKVFDETGPDGVQHPIYTAPPKAGSLGGFPIYGDTLFIARPGREFFVPISVQRALKAAMVVYATNRDAAERELVERKKRNLEFKSGEADDYEQKELAKFEKQWGYLRSSDVKDYEEHKRQWMAPVLRQRQEHEAAAAPPVRGNRDSEWYFNAIDGYANAQKRLASLSAEEASAPACYQPLDLRLPYAMRGEVHRSTGDPACLPLVVTNPNYYDRTLPRTAPQLMTVTSITRCVKPSGDTFVAPSGPISAGGCAVHARMWQQVNWQGLADILVK
ncbi:hypothetical protein [Paludibaculum fermentans]|uniref:Uncharacterized protein n=1 Tax=Paludibaculum fermentans TaxID=1473598 RepID=A0A7S7SLJ6_PALFE|nr:hypothetical protein [Paludibaculum fermentans]QOY90322.1 hypothetical protein IRI77_10310 [Paludibaculum fermentans]